MKMSKAIQAYLCLFALLFSNVAGWVHLGCVATTSGFQVREVSDLPKQLQSARGCCHHHRLSEASPAKGHASSNKKPKRSGQDHRSNHDSQQCHICQSFLTLRQASHFLVSISPIVEAPSIRFVTQPTENEVGSAIGNGISGRGPPKA